MSNYFPAEIQEDGLRYFSETLGLDPTYIENFIVPVVWGHYLHPANSLSTLFRLLPLYCPGADGLGKSIILHETPKKISERIVHRIRAANLHVVDNQTLSSYAQVKVS